MKKNIARTAFQAGALALLMGAAGQSVWSQSRAPATLFKVITDKDEVIIGMTPQELQTLGGQEKNAGAVARALADRKALTVWQYSVRHGANGELQLAPLHQIGLLASQSLRVEPYSSALPVVPRD
jgi:hypothetical protein